MARKERRSPAASRVQGLLEAGDWRAARREAQRRIAAGGGERDALEAELRRLRPQPAGAAAAALGLVLLAAVAALGLLLR